MLNEKQLQEIREHLENSKNPVFFFDNDSDGLCSFLLLQRFIGRGRGISLKGLPSLNKAYYKRAEEFNADCIFVLDRPSVDKEVIELNKNGKNLPIICIDHHQPDEVPDVAGYYNTYLESKKSEPTSYLCYKATEKKEDIWLAVLGCVADCYIPDFFDEFKKKYSELLDAPFKTAFDIIYKTRLGKIIRVLNLSLKDTTSNTVTLYKFMMKASSPGQVLEENNKTETFLNRYELLNKIINKSVEKAGENIDKKNKVIFFTYGGDMSISQDVANQLSYIYQGYHIIIGFIKGGHVKFSLRGEKIRTLMMRAIKNIDGAFGGGHEVSCGAQMSSDSVEKFKENLMREIIEENKNKN